MPRSEVTVTIRRSPADVFGVLSDVENISKWYPKPVTDGTDEAVARWTCLGSGIFFG